jgi:hypothetical protein
MCDGRLGATLDDISRPCGAGAAEVPMAGAIEFEVRIQVQGELDPAAWDAQFDGLLVLPEPDGTTLLTGEVIDQAAVHGLVAAIRDLGLSLLLVEVIARPHPDRVEGASR